MKKMRRRKNKPHIKNKRELARRNAAKALMDSVKEKIERGELPPVNFDLSTARFG
jgi:hypothetical protein